MNLRCHHCGRREIGRSPAALPLGWIALFVNCWFGRGGAWRALCFRCQGEAGA